MSVCPACNGSGVIEDNPFNPHPVNDFSESMCPTCHGSGMVFDEETLERWEEASEREAERARRMPPPKPCRDDDDDDDDDEPGFFEDLRDEIKDDWGIIKKKWHDIWD